MHIPVLRDKVIEFLKPLEGKIILDATVGTGGHAEAILEEMGPTGQLIGLDLDTAALESARQRLAPWQSRVLLRQGNFAQLSDILEENGMNAVDGVLMDLGLSSLQLEDAERGFSFQTEGPLDMRMNMRQQTTAWEMVNRLDEGKLRGLIREYGEEPFSKRIAAAIVSYRKNKSITSTKELADIVAKAVPRRAWPRRIHPATRTFQAIRIAVNQELENLKQGLSQAILALRKGGKLLVISYHSLEDRIVKNFFKTQKSSGWNILTRKPIVASEEEISANRKARSAKLRVLECSA